MGLDCKGRRIYLRSQNRLVKFNRAWTTSGAIRKSRSGEKPVRGKKKRPWREKQRRWPKEASVPLWLGLAKSGLEIGADLAHQAKNKKGLGAGAVSYETRETTRERSDKKGEESR